MTDYQQVFAAIAADPRYLANLDWGEARPGHPEGTIRAHIAELERNLHALRPKVTDQEAWKLKVLIHTHDTFKPQARADVPIAHPQSHASLARAFLAMHCDDPELLAIVQYHDEPFALYRQQHHRGRYSAQRFEALLNAIGDWDLFLAFAIIDGCTAGKSREPMPWLFRELAGRIESRFSEADIQPPAR
ncbi:MAG: hypothetical protein WD872_04110 [Pirellulaceae bacterium]